MEPIFRAGASFPTATNITEEEASAYWSEPGKVRYVVEDVNGNVLGSYYIRPNQPTLGGHICNAGYLVSPAAREQGIGSAMCLHSQEEARAKGYLGMQYNLVVTTNLPAVRLWQKHGFEILGTIPNSFNHRDYGLVDAHIMFKWLQ